MFSKFIVLVDTFNNEYEKYTKKLTKASSKRLRGIINQMQKTAVSAKKDLLARDKGE